MTKRKPKRKIPLNRVAHLLANLAEETGDIVIYKLAARHNKGTILIEVDAKRRAFVESLDDNRTAVHELYNDSQDVWNEKEEILEQLEEAKEDLSEREERLNNTSRQLADATKEIDALKQKLKQAESELKNYRQKEAKEQIQVVIEAMNNREDNSANEPIKLHE